MIPVYLSPIANHLWQSTLFGGVAALLALALRQNRAQVRYGIWLAASLKFLVPFSLLLAIGNRVEWQTAQTAALPLSPAIGQMSEPFSPMTFARSAAPVPEPTSSVPAILLLAWVCGFA